VKPEKDRRCTGGIGDRNPAVGGVEGELDSVAPGFVPPCPGMEGGAGREQEEREQKVPRGGFHDGYDGDVGDDWDGDQNSPKRRKVQRGFQARTDIGVEAPGAEVGWEVRGTPTSRDPFRPLKSLARLPNP